LDPEFGVAPTQELGLNSVERRAGRGLKGPQKIDWWGVNGHLKFEGGKSSELIGGNKLVLG